MQESKKPNNKKFNEALCYAPLWSVLVHFIVEDKDKTKDLKKHMKYGFIIFIVYLVASFLLWWLMSGLILVIYLGLAGFLAYKVYTWEDVNLDIIDDFEKKL